MCIPLQAVYRKVVCLYLLQVIFFRTYRNFKIVSLQKNVKKKMEKKKCKKREKNERRDREKVMRG